MIHGQSPMPDHGMNSHELSCYRSGEIAHDWWFFVCNNHDFWGDLRRASNVQHPFGDGDGTAQMKQTQALLGERRT